MGNISVTEPMSPALERVKQILFRPFDLGKWFVIGFCAWLAYLGEQGGFNGNFGNHSGGGQNGDIHQQFDHARQVFLENLYWIVPLGIGLFVLMLAFWVLMIWLSSRGKFMFLHC